MVPGLSAELLCSFFHAHGDLNPCLLIHLLPSQWQRQKLQYHARELQAADLIVKFQTFKTCEQ